MSGALLLNAEWELTRLRRSRRLWLLVLPIVAAPIGSAVADLYLRIPSLETARVLGLFITAGLAGLLALDLVALAVGEDLSLGAHLTAFTLPQGRRAQLAGRTTLVMAGVLGSYGVGAVLVWTLSGLLVTPSTGAAAPIVLPLHLALGLPGLLLFLGGVTAAGAVVTRSAAQSLVAGVLAGVVAAGVGSWFLLERSLTALFPVGLAAVGLVGFAWSLYRFPSLEA
ncbi:MAG: hypothetical protein L3K13_01625 [Thermoplasmata archaeon]|nr:hypothetical protein [Thermoplasmata archaeon]